MSELVNIIKAEIAASGSLTFARFMEMALYQPGLGYYETGRNRVGFKGDFYTSVSTGELFGQLLAFRFAHWLETLPSTADRWIIEAGAHDGKLAYDILHWLREYRPDLFASMRYGMLEPSPDRQQWQRERLSEFGERVKWFEDLAALGVGTACPPTPLIANALNGVIFSNELLDAMPVHRLGWDAQKQMWFEWGVTLEGDGLAWTKLASATVNAGTTADWPEELLRVLPAGYTIEVCPAAEKWWSAAASILKQGWLLTLDYGFTAEERISPSRTEGTVRAYARHKMSDDLLANPGEQDLTAHVNFTAIQAAGECAGLQTAGYWTQPQFLTKILAEAIKDPAFADWNASRTRQFQTLTHPQHLGRAFKVLVQEKRSTDTAPDNEQRKARLRLKRAREAAGKHHDELARFVGISTSSYYDLEECNDDLYACVSLGELAALCTNLEIKASDLFGDEAITSPKISPDELISMARTHLQKSNLSILDFGERIGFEIAASLDNPQKVLEWNVDFLRWLCLELKIDWRRALP